MPYQKGTMPDQSKSSTESPKKIASTTSADKQSSVTYIKQPLFTQKWEPPGDTFRLKVALIKETTTDMSTTYAIPEETGEILLITEPF